MTDGALILRDGRLEAVGSGIRPPADAVIHDLQGKTVYAGLVDAYTEIGLGAAAPPAPNRAAHWNPLVTPQLEAARLFVPDSVAAKTLRDQGVTVALVAPPRGILKGRSAVVTLDAPSRGAGILKPDAALHVSFYMPPPDVYDSYPTSSMGRTATRSRSGPRSSARSSKGAVNLEEKVLWQKYREKYRRLGIPQPRPAAAASGTTSTGRNE